ILEEGGSKRIVVSPLGKEVELGPGQTINCYCEIEPNELIAGLAGPDDGSVGVLRLSLPPEVDGKLELKVQSEVLLKPSRRQSELAENPVLWLAKARVDGSTIVFVGCGGGQIISFDPLRHLDPKRPPASVVTRLHAPVWELTACVTLDRKLRLYAGGAD